MRTQKMISRIMVAGLLLLPICAPTACGPAPLRTATTQQGGNITYGPVDGANSQKAALLAMLRNMHTECGEKPQIGQVFKLRGTDAVGLYFTVVNHSAGNTPTAGLIIAATSGPQKVEAAMMTDSASRFPSTINPMLRKLSGVWRPSGLTGTASGSPASTPAAGGYSASSVRLHTVTTSDNSASISVPDGWTLQGGSNGMIAVSGPNGEQVDFNMVKSAIDPTNPYQMQTARQHYNLNAPGTISYAYRGNLTNEFVNIFQAWRRSMGKGPAKIQVDKISTLPGAQNSQTVQASGQMDPDGKGMQSFSDMMIVDNPNPRWGTYSVQLYHTTVPLALVDKEGPMIHTIMNSWRPNMNVIKSQNAQLLAQKQQRDQQTRAWGQQVSNNIRQTTANATAINQATQQRNDAQHAGYWADQDNKARQGQGFSNYIRDETVIRDVQYPDEHATVWNKTAWTLQQAFPDRVEEVPPSQYIKGQDYY